MLCNIFRPGWFRDVFFRRNRESVPSKVVLVNAFNRIPARKDVTIDRGWQGIVDILDLEHECIALLLKQLAFHVNFLQPRKIPDYHFMLNIVEYLASYPGVFHHPREDMLFEKIQTQCEGLVGIQAKLAQEHVDLHEGTKTLLAELTAIANGAAADRPELIKTIRVYTRLYLEHLKYESEHVFPLVSGPITDQEWSEIDAKTCFLDDPVFGGECNDKYSRMVRIVNLV